MRTQAINNTTERKNTNIVVAGATGAAGAALLTRYLPLTHAEHADAFTKSVKEQISGFVKDAKNAEFDKIVDEFAKNQAYQGVSDVFTKNRDNIVSGAKESLADIAKGLDDNSKGIFTNLADRVSEVGNLVENQLNHNVIKQAKKSRPAIYFAALAGAAAMTAAVVKNTIQAKQVKDQTVAISYDKQGMLIDAPDSLSLAIILDEYV